MKTITFYSYKGGVGRSLALANIATRLAEFDKKVCLMDFDLEAPGLPMKFASFIGAERINLGIVDYIYEFTNGGRLEKSIAKYSLQFQTSYAKTSFFMIPAGNPNSKEYWRKLSCINWFDLLYDNPNGLSFFFDMKEKIEKELKPDFLLIDSRTGISEMSSVVLSLLADDVVIVAANNVENLNGAKKIIESLKNPTSEILKTNPKITFVLSRIPFTEKAEDKSKEQLLLNKLMMDFDGKVSEINVIHSDPELELNEQIKIGYEKDQSAAQISRDYLNLFEKLTRDSLTEEEIKKFNDIKESEKLFQQAGQTAISDQKLSLLNRAITLNDSNINFYMSRGVVYLDIRDFEKARADFEHILRIDDKNLQANFKMAKLYNDSEDYQKAIIYITKFIDINPNSFVGYNSLGVTYMKSGHYEKAIQYFDKSIQINPFDAVLYNNRASAFRVMGKHDSALEDIYKSLELNLDYYLAYSTLAEIMADLGNVSQFYLHLEIFIRNSVAAKRQFVETILADEFYAKYQQNKRFLDLMEKYDIMLPYIPAETVHVAGQVK